MLAPMRMRQFRSTDQAYQRWKAIRLPHGDQDFSTVVRAALDRLYKELVESKPPADNGWKAHSYRPCADCHQLKIVDESGLCPICYLVAVSNGKIRRAVELPTPAPPANGTTAAPPAKRTTKDVAPKKQSAKARPAKGSPAAKAKKAR